MNTHFSLELSFSLSHTERLEKCGRTRISPSAFDIRKQQMNESAGESEKRNVCVCILNYALAKQ